MTKIGTRAHIHLKYSMLPYFGDAYVKGKFISGSIYLLATAHALKGMLCLKVRY